MRFKMEKNSIIYLAGHTGLIGSALMTKLIQEGYRNIVTRTHKRLDLTSQQQVEKFFKKNRPDYVILSAGKVGGIYSNSTYPAQFLYENVAMQTNVIHASHKYDVKKLLFLACACTYPKDCPQPIKEPYLLSGHLEPTNEAYSVAKIAGIKMCQAYNQQYHTNYICAVPTNAYGPHDNFDLKDAHVIPALIRRFHHAKITGQPFLEVWGSGTPRRTFVYSDDLAGACIFLMQDYDKPEIINIGPRESATIQEIAILIKKVIGYAGEIRFDISKPDGVPRKELDVSRINKLGWKTRVKLKEGIARTYQWYIKQFNSTTKRSRSR